MQMLVEQSSLHTQYCWPHTHKAQGRRFHTGSGRTASDAPLTCRCVMFLSMFMGEVTQFSEMYLKPSGYGWLSTPLTQGMGTLSWPRAMSLQTQHRQFRLTGCLSATRRTNSD